MIKYSIHLPRLCDRTTLQEIARLHPTSLSVTENEAPLSTAQMELPMSDQAVQVGQFVELYDAKGSLGYYRISEVHRNYRGGVMQTVYLEHGLSTLANDVIFGGVTYEKDGQSARSVLNGLLNKQTVRYWQLWTDSTEYAADLAYLDQQKPEFYFEDQDLLQAILDLMATLERELTLVTDMTAFPWKLIPRAVPKTATSEARLSRNIESLKLGYDWNSLCTRLYPKGSSSGESTITIADATGSGGKLYIDSDTQSTWGVISQIWTDSDAASADALFAKAKKHLEEVKNPVVSITLDGHDLSGLTGESLDSFECGYPCQISIPEDGVSLCLRILTVQHPDLITDPARVTLTIGTADKRKVSRQRAQQAAGGGGGGGGGRTKTDTETYTLIGTKREGETTLSIGSFPVSSEWTEVSSVTLKLEFYNVYGTAGFGLYIDGKAYGWTTGGGIAIMSYMRYSGSGVARGSHTLYGQYADADSEFNVRATVTIKGKKPIGDNSSDE